MATIKPEPPVLSAEDAQSQVWRKLLAHIEKRTAELRAMNDSPKLDDRQTARLRGQIKELKNLAALDQPALQTEADDGFED